MATMTSLGGELDTTGIALVPSENEEALVQLANDQPGDKVHFYELEGKLLDLWDRLNDLKLQIAVLETTSVPDSQAPTLSDEAADIELDKAEKELANARAEYLLRQSVIEDTIIISPILNAVHAGAGASATERTLKPLLDRRDALQIASTNLSSILKATSEKTRLIEREEMKVRENNQPLAAEVRELTRRVDQRKEEAKADPSVRIKLEKATEDADTAIRQWRIMKSLVAGVVAGSGIDWSADAGLRDLVLDAEDEND